jgi:ABC-2 type transport system ATP-binding protein
MTFALKTEGLGKRYGKFWALRECELAIPEGRVAALVGPNGAGKTTLLELAVGLQHPTTGFVTIAGYSPTKEAKQALPRLGFLAQEHPLYRHYTVSETFTLSRQLNVHWDTQLAEQRMQQLNIPLWQKVGRLSGGQAAQVALAIALAKHPTVLVLDEPFASLDPLARRDFQRALMAEIAERGISVLLSSHLITDLERTCDYLIILMNGQVRLAGEIEAILAEHWRAVGPRDAIEALASCHTIISREIGDRQASVILCSQGPIFDPAWDLQPVTLETVVLAYLEGDRALLAPPVASLEVVR